VQDLDPVAIPSAQAGAHLPTVVDLDALRLAPFPVSRPRTTGNPVREVMPEREPTFDELLHAVGAQATDRRGAALGRTGWLRSRRAARATDPRAKRSSARTARGRAPRVAAAPVKAPPVKAAIRRAAR
jgi:hypothetical protein